MVVLHSDWLITHLILLLTSRFYIWFYKHWIRRLQFLPSEKVEMWDSVSSLSGWVCFVWTSLCGTFVNIFWVVVFGSSYLTILSRRGHTRVIQRGVYSLMWRDVSPGRAWHPAASQHHNTKILRPVASEFRPVQVTLRHLCRLIPWFTSRQNTNSHTHRLPRVCVHESLCVSSPYLFDARPYLFVCVCVCV